MPGFQALALFGFIERNLRVRSEKRSVVRAARLANKV
jgi:hypothetical protein